MNNNQNILDKFTYHFKKALITAQNLALAKKHEAIEPEDLLISLIKTKGALASDILIKQKANTNFLNMTILADDYQTINIAPESLPQPSPESQKIIERAVTTAYKYQHKYIGTEHLLWGLSESSDKNLQEILTKANINVFDLKQHLNLILKSTSKFSDLTADEELKELENIFEETTKENAGALENFTINLTTEEVQQNIDPVIGRSREIERLIEILSRRTKNNPVLLGDAGVGKTAIIEGLAKRIMTSDVPDVLLNKTILNLDISSLIAGTMYRGEFENRLKQVINEVKNNPDIILFIDELHTIMGAGATTGALDAANILKPALSRGTLRCIGATTFEEYKKHIESDRALERRFQPIIIEESSEAETYEILKGIKSNYEKFHSVKITDEALQTAIILSKRFIPDKKLPDKAIDLIDQAAARWRVKHTKKSLAKKIKALSSQIELCQNNKKQAILAEDYLAAMDYKRQETQYQNELAQLKALEEKNQQKYLGQVDSQQIKEIIANLINTPISDIDDNANKPIVDLEKKLSQHIFGQSAAINTIANTIRKSKAGLQDKNRPLASFMFLGPSGVGKTETAKQLSRYVLGGDHHLLRIDMSEFSEKFNISKLIGSPAGYVGYKEGNKLTDVVKNHPYTLILFDEIEKAHPDVFNLLLPILEEGELTDATGRTVNFRNSIIVMTSNIGLSQFNQEAVMGFNTGEAKDKFEHLRQRILGSLSQHFPPEFTNRLNNIVVFEPLDEIAAKNIIKKELSELSQRLNEKNISLDIDPKIIGHLLKMKEAIKEGARSLKRLVDTHVANPLATHLLANPVNKLEIVLDKEKIVIK